MRYSKDARISDKVAELLKDGWVIKHWSRHLRITEPKLKLTLTVPGSPSDHRAVQNWLHQIRKVIGDHQAKL